jgi:hypothetical protein
VIFVFIRLLATWSFYLFLRKCLFGVAKRFLKSLPANTDRADGARRRTLEPRITEMSLAKKGSPTPETQVTTLRDAR